MTFEEYLRERHAEQYRGVDDDMADDFEKWISELDVAEVIEWAEKWGKNERKSVFDLFEEGKKYECSVDGDFLYIQGFDVIKKLKPISISK